ncbi:hypothetical protein D3C80_1408340 [compost metagenome]
MSWHNVGLTVHEHLNLRRVQHKARCRLTRQYKEVARYHATCNPRIARCKHSCCLRSRNGRLVFVDEVDLCTEVVSCRRVVQTILRMDTSGTGCRDGVRTNACSTIKQHLVCQTHCTNFVCTAANCCVVHCSVCKQIECSVGMTIHAKRFAVSNIYSQTQVTSSLGTSLS